MILDSSSSANGLGFTRFAHWTTPVFGSMISSQRSICFLIFTDFIAPIIDQKRVVIRIDPKWSRSEGGIRGIAQWRMTLFLIFVLMNRWQFIQILWGYRSRERRRIHKGAFVEFKGMDFMMQCTERLVPPDWSWQVTDCGRDRVIVGSGRGKGKFSCNGRWKGLIGLVVGKTRFVEGIGFVLCRHRLLM